MLDAQGAVIDDAVAKGTIKDNDAASDAADDALEDALAVAEGLTPDEAAGALFGERRLSEARLAALDLLGNRNGRYDLGDLLAWIDRCRRGEARCGPTSTGSGPPSAAGLLAAAAAGGRRTPRRTRRRGSGRPGRKPIRTARRRGRFAGYALATLLAATLTLSCTEGSVAPAAYVQDPGFLTVEWSGPAAQSRCRRSAGVGGSHDRRRAGSWSRVVRIQRARTAPDRRGGRPPPRSPRAVPGAGPGPVRSVPGPRP